MPSHITHESIAHAIGLIGDGFQFEKLCQSVISGLFGHGFKPIGGVHDGGADGSIRVFEDDSAKDIIFQFSIQEDTRAKIRKTAERLIKTRPNYARLVYVTAQTCRDSDIIESELAVELKKGIRVFDKVWLVNQILSNQACQIAYLTFVEANFHQFNTPGQSTYISNLDRDPRVFVFLRQQFDDYNGKSNLDILLADSLILLSLEGTNPDEKRFRNKDEIIEKVRSHLGSTNSKIENLCVKRLEKLSAKPNRIINHHRDIDAYCLPFETRVKIKQRTIDDEAMHEAFTSFLDYTIANVCVGKGSAIQTGIKKYTLESISALFKKQGIDFSNCIAASNLKCLEDVVSLDDIIDSAIGKLHGNSAREREEFKRLTLSVIRRIVYQGDRSTLEFLRRLGQTYMMLFLTQCDPAVSNHFYTLASKQKIFVCTSILIPVLSEVCMPIEHRRYYNLLKSASSSGVSLFVTPIIVNELASHIKNTILEFQNFYNGNEAPWMDRASISLIKKILIRSYFYAKIDGYVSSFPDYIDSFVSYGSADRETELIEWLHAEFGIKYVTEESMNIAIKEDEYKQIYTRLLKTKSSGYQADGDARTILTILKLRERDSVEGSGIFGYSTWWLSLDRSTMRAAQEVLGDRPTCYMRPDFLVNYIALTPHPHGVDETYTSLFPTLAGASISQHFNQKIQDGIAQAVADFRNKTPSRVQALIRAMTDRLRVDPTVYNDSEFRRDLSSLPDATA